MAKSRQDELIKFDSRMIDWNLSRGIITKEEYEKHLASLPDLSAQAEKIELDETSDSSDILN
ncbi:MAG: hypothetical protein KF767_14220 [Bdellovibrionaceae bacterium]|nr:hypothetical protein [Pseudobdellovibrionaceae bacterium]